MRLLTSIRLVAFLAILAAVLLPAPARAQDACPGGYCNDCPNQAGAYWGDYNGNCCGCSFVGYCTYNGGGYNLCYCPNAC